MAQDTAEHADRDDERWAGPFDWPAAPDEVFKIANTPDTDLRAHRIALAYYSLSAQLDDYLFGPESVRRRNAARVAVRRTEANWFHFALWGTLTVTRNIGQERAPERLAVLPDALRRNLTPWVIAARASASQEVSRALAWGQRLMFLSISTPFVEVLNRAPDPPRRQSLARLLRISPKDAALGPLALPIILDVAAECEGDGLGDVPDREWRGPLVSMNLRSLRAEVEELKPESWEAIAASLFEQRDAEHGPAAGPEGAVPADDPGGGDAKDGPPADPEGAVPAEERDVAVFVEDLLHELEQATSANTMMEPSLVALALDWRELSELEQLSSEDLTAAMQYGLIPVAWLLDTPPHWMDVLILDDRRGEVVTSAAGLLADRNFARRLVEQLTEVGSDNWRDALRAVRLLRPECQDMSPVLSSATLMALRRETDWGRSEEERKYFASVQMRRHLMAIEEAISWYQLVRRLHRIRRRLEVLARHLPTQSRHLDRLERVLDELDHQISRLILTANIQLTAVEQDLVNPAVRTTVDHFPTEVAAFVKRQLAKAGEYASGLSTQIASFGLESRFRPLEVGMRSLWARFMTDQVFVMALPTETVRLGRDIPPRDFRAPYFPPTLADLERIGRGVWSAATWHVLDKAGRQVRSFDVARDRGRGSAAHDWRRFDERMRFATTLMRTRQTDETLFWAPFMHEDITRIERGELPRRSGHPTDRQINAPLGPTQWFDDDDEGYG